MRASRSWTRRCPQRPLRGQKISSATWVFLLALIIQVLLSTAVRADCFWPDGSQNLNYAPCYVSHGGAIGLCCRSGDMCLANGLCQKTSSQTDNNFNYYRGGCTFPNYNQGENCPTVCLRGSGINMTDDVGMGRCPHSDSNWFCIDNNADKVNCSSGNHVVTLLGKPSPFTTIGVSPSSTEMLSSSATPTEGTTTAMATASNSTETPMPTNGTAPAPSGMLPDPSSSPPPGPQSKNAVVPLAVGISIGGAAITLAAAIGVMLWRKRKRNELARAESPPPRDTPDGIFDSGPETFFRSGSLHHRLSTANMTCGGDVGGGIGSGSTDIPPSATVMTARTNSLRQGSILSSRNHPSNSRFTPDAVAMHDVPRAPSMGWEQRPDSAHSPRQQPEIPYDGRRFAPYHGVPPGELTGYSELPG